MKKRIGIMQGRLSSRKDKRIQSFPTKYWEKEFEIASDIGFDSIEWVIDDGGIDDNPISSKKKQKIIKGLMNRYRISIPAICHDQLMQYPIHSVDDEVSNFARDTLTKTIEICNAVGIEFIEIPLVGVSSIRTNEDFEKFVNIILQYGNKAEEYGLCFVLETDLSPSMNVNLMENLDGLAIGLNYDMGNSAFWEFNPDKELPLIGQWIKNVHVKDCTPKDYTVPLGEGNVDFEKVFTYLGAKKYQGQFILQAAPAPDGQEKHVMKEYFNFTQSNIIRYLHES